MDKDDAIIIYRGDKGCVGYLVVCPHLESNPEHFRSMEPFSNITNRTILINKMESWARL